jgi:antitoxin VapB
LFRNGRNQAVRIPRDLELPGTDATIRKENGKLIIEADETRSLLAWLKTIEPWDEEFPEVEDPPPADVKI